MRARAHLATERAEGPDGRPRTRVSTHRSEAPLMLRSTLETAPDPYPPWAAYLAGAARVHLAAGAAGPVGGDRLALRVDVGAASALILRDVSATLLLPGPRGDRSHTRVDIHVAAEATLLWLPEPVIAARNCHHRTDVQVELEPGARLLLREELLLGRHGEPPGSVDQNLRVRLAGRPLHHQRLVTGPDATGWDGPAVSGGHRAIGSLLVVDPAWHDSAPPGRALGDDAVLMASHGPAVVVSALRPDNLELRRSLDTGLAALHSPPIGVAIPEDHASAHVSAY